MPASAVRPDEIPMPALLRLARVTYGAAMRRALQAAGYDDLPKNGPHVIGGLRLADGDLALGRLIRDLNLSKQSAGQLVDTLVTRGYLRRRPDDQDRRRLLVTLTERGRAAAQVQAAARARIDAQLLEKVGVESIAHARCVLAALIELGARQG